MFFLWKINRISAKMNKKSVLISFLSISKMADHKFNPKNKVSGTFFGIFPKNFNFLARRIHHKMQLTYIKTSIF